MTKTVLKKESQDSESVPSQVDATAIQSVLSVRTRTWERMLKEDGLQMQFKSDIKCSEISAYPPNHNFEEEEPIWTKTWY